MRRLRVSTIRVSAGGDQEFVLQDNEQIIGINLIDAGFTLEILVATEVDAAETEPPVPV